MKKNKCKEQGKGKIKEYRISKHIIMIYTVLFIPVLLVACRQTSNEPMSKTTFALDTVSSITIYDSKDEKILDNAIELIDKYENIYSKTIETSELYKLNNRELTSINDNPYTCEISDELSEIINYGLEYSRVSNGAFDITIEPLSSLWDFKAEEPTIPDSGHISNAINIVGYENVELEGNIITLKNEETKIDLGAIAKGYIADKVKEYLISQDVQSAIIDLGGNILCVGEKPGKEPFTIGIQKPFADRNEIVATMDIRDKSVVTSGIYERYFNIDGQIYHHILNPDTGYPYNNDLISVTIVSSYSVDGDGLSTTCFALGLQEGMELINGLEDTHAIFITEDYEFYYSEGFFENIDVSGIKGE